MLLQLTQMGAIKAAVNSALGLGSNSVPFLDGALAKLITSPTVALNGTTLWGSVSAYVGGYDGYGDGTLSFGAPIVNSANVVVTDSNQVTWRPTDSSFSVSGYGIVITDPGSTSVFMAGAFDVPPVVLNSPYTAFLFNVSYNPASPSSSIVTYIY